MSGMTRRGFMGAVAAASVGYTAGCVGNEETTGCGEYDFDTGEYAAVSSDALDTEYQHILEGVVDNRDTWLEEANDRFGDEELYDGPLFAVECGDHELYPAGAIDTEYEGKMQSDTEQYDVGCGVTTHADGPLADMHELDAEYNREADMLLSIGLEAPVTALIAVPAVSMQQEDRDMEKEVYEQFLEDINGITSQVVDHAGNRVEAYVPREEVQTFAGRFGPEDNTDVFRDIRAYMEENMEHKGGNDDGLLSAMSDTPILTADIDARSLR